jgi:hypothetical protein
MAETRKKENNRMEKRKIIIVKKKKKSYTQAAAPKFTHDKRSATHKGRHPSGGVVAS